MLEWQSNEKEKKKNWKRSDILKTRKIPRKRELPANARLLFQTNGTVNFSRN